MKLKGYDDLDIKPARLNEQMTESSQRNAVLYDVHISLSEMPPPEWGDFFARAWKTQMSNMYRRAHISGQNIVIENCALNEVDGRVCENGSVLPARRFNVGRRCVAVRRSKAGAYAVSVLRPRHDLARPGSPCSSRGPMELIRGGLRVKSACGVEI